MSRPISKSRMVVAKNYEDLCRHAVQNIFSLSEASIAARGRFMVVLAGGSTPKGAYALMASSDYREQFEWNKIHFFWGDERWVPPDDAQSNYRMAAEALLTKVDIPPENIHPIRTIDGTPETSAALYEKHIRSFFSLKNSETPRFDLLLLGLGQDGHVASLFPGSPALFQTSRLVLPVVGKEIKPSRVTVTLPLINNSESVFLLASGREKAEAMKAVVEGAGNNRLPVQQIDPHDGEVLWFTDQLAVSLLKKEPTEQI